MKVLILLLLSLNLHAKTCEYSYTVWNTRLRKSLGPIRVQKPYAQLTKQEKGPSGCSPCEADQVDVTLMNGVQFRACRSYAESFKKVLNLALQKGKSIRTVVGYRPSISKGKEDAQGLRTEFSHHAFGTALDINEEANGLYGNCLSWHPGCRLIKGGVYSLSNPLSIRDKDELVTLFLGIGFQWGGKIQGVQKDFMHFSLDGY